MSIDRLDSLFQPADSALQRDGEVLRRTYADVVVELRCWHGEVLAVTAYSTTILTDPDDVRYAKYLVTEPERSERTMLVTASVEPAGSGAGQGAGLSQLPGTAPTAGAVPTAATGHPTSVGHPAGTGHRIKVECRSVVSAGATDAQLLDVVHRSMDLCAQGVSQWDRNVASMASDRAAQQAQAAQQEQTPGGPAQTPGGQP